MKTSVKLLFVLIISALVSGCFTAKNNINYFTINYPKENLTQKDLLSCDYNIIVTTFTTSELYGKKMIFIKKPNEVLIDNSNHWAQQPTTIITNYFSIFLNNRIKPFGIKVKNYTLKGEIIQFEGNIDQKTSDLTLKLELKNNLGETLLNKFFTIKTPMKKLTASDFANTMSETVKTAANDFYNDLKNIKRKK